MSERLLVPDKDKSLRDGGILYYKGMAESKEQKYLEALCETYGINIDKKVSELTDKEMHLLLYANEKIKYKLSYKEGKRRKQHFCLSPRSCIRDYGKNDTNKQYNINSCVF